MVGDVLSMITQCILHVHQYVKTSGLKGAIFPSEMFRKILCFRTFNLFIVKLITHY